MATKNTTATTTTASRYATSKPKPRKKDDRILVVIPYCSEGAQGRELEYAVAGWRKHFKEKYLIVIAGEDAPIAHTGDDIVCVPSERVPERDGQYRQHLDYVSCFRKVREQYPDQEGFVFVADDVYAVNNFDIIDIKVLKQVGANMAYAANSANAWERDAARTASKLLAEGYPIRNFTTHLPQYFEWDKLAVLWDRFDMDNTSYVFEDLYYNIYFPDRVPLQLHIDHDNFKCGIYRENPDWNKIRNAFDGGKIWIQNNPRGWSPQLDWMLAEYYGI